MVKALASFRVECDTVSGRKSRKINEHSAYYGNAPDGTPTAIATTVNPPLGSGEATVEEVEDPAKDDDDLGLAIDILTVAKLISCHVL